MTGTVALYMRLSCEDENAGESLSIANQRDLLRGYVESRREFDGCPVLEFADDGYSGTNFERPGIKKLLSLAGKDVQCIIVKDFSRFGRNLVEVGGYLDQIFPFLGVRFIAVNEGYDSSRAAGSTVGLDVSLKALVYEMYSRDISEKVRCVQQAKMKKGEYLCGIAFYGYRRSETEKNRLEVDPGAAVVVRRIFGMAADGMMPGQIAVALNGEGIPSPLMYRRANHTDGTRGWKTAGGTTYWTTASVSRILCDERYTGCLVGRKRTVADLSTKRTEPVPKEEWIVAENTHEALVDRELFTQVQGALRHNARNPHVRRPYRKFRGLLKCACCGRTLARRECRQPYYFCPTAEAVRDFPCKRVRVEENALEETMLEAIQAYIRLIPDSGQEREGEAGERLREEMKACQSVSSRYQTLLADLFEDYAEDRIGRQEYLLKKQEIAKRQEEAGKRLEELAYELAQVQKGAEEKSAALGKYAFAKELTREMLVELVKEVRASGKDTMEITWNFKDPCGGSDGKE